MPSLSFDPQVRQSVFLDVNHIAALLDSSAEQTQFTNSLISMMWSFGNLTEIEKVQLAANYGTTSRYELIASFAHTLPKPVRAADLRYFELLLLTYSQEMFELCLGTLREMYETLSHGQREELRQRITSQQAMLLEAELET